MKFSKRTELFGTNIFSELEAIRQVRLQKGLEVINLSVGTPDLAPSEHVISAFTQGGKDPQNYKYSLNETNELKDAVVNWYLSRYGVSLGHKHIVACHGSQEGIAHIPLILCDEGDIVLVPNPGYPIFSVGPMLSGAKLYEVPLLEQNDYVMDLDAIDENIAKQAKVIIVSYPNNPTTATAPYAFYEKLVAFAKKYDIVVVHDNAYSELVFDGQPGMSFLSVPGAFDVGVEFNSLSKSYNMTGLRISFCLGNEEIIHKFRVLKSQIDYGISYPVQIAAIAALSQDQTFLQNSRKEYKARRDTLVAGLNGAGMCAKGDGGTMFVWCKIPEGFADSISFSKTLLEQTGVICVPGASFGSLGDRYVRFALVEDCAQLKRATELIQSLTIHK